MTIRQKVMARVAELGATVEEYGDYFSKSIEVIAPAHMHFESEGLHELVAAYYTDKPDAWADLWDRLENETVTPCDGSCEYWES